MRQWKKGRWKTRNCLVADVRNVMMNKIYFVSQLTFCEWGLLQFC